MNYMKTKEIVLARKAIQFMVNQISLKNGAILIRNELYDS